jgi:hypothetical protein
VPVSVIVHDETIGVDAVPLASHEITSPDKVPRAVPSSFRSPAQVALNDPAALVAVRSVTFHLKSAQDEGEGITLDDPHDPASVDKAVPGAIVELFSSKLIQPAAARPAAIAMTSDFFMKAHPSGFEGEPYRPLTNAKALNAKMITDSNPAGRDRLGDTRRQQ